MIALFLPLPPPPAEYRIDFARWAGVPLLKTKFGVYETPFVQRDELVRSLDLVREIGVRDLRYELAWGKPDAVAGDMVRTTGIDFGFVDALLGRCRALGIRPLLATGYCPLPLQSRTGWPAWKDVPKDLDAWSAVHRAFAEHLRGRGIAYEVWNEPDMPEGSDKMFFTRSPEAYGRVYDAATKGLRAGDPDAAIGGPAAAYDLRYLAPVLAGTADFASIHGYANYPAQIAGMRKALASRPDLPILLTEYASFNDFRKDGPAVRSNAAAAFFRDADGLLGLTDVTTVYWAQWIDDYLGLVSRDGHRRALFNAFKAYGAMPTDRVAVEPLGPPANGLTVLAAASATEAAIAIANPTDDDRTVSLRLDRLPLKKGSWRLMRIDRSHASFVDAPSTEALKVDETVPLGARWTGVVPAQGVAFLHAGAPTPARIPEGRVVRTHRWFPRRESSAYADFDPATWTARLGGGATRIGVQVDGLRAFRVAVTQQGAGPAPSLRMDFRGRSGVWSESVVYGDEAEPPRWGTGRAARRIGRLGGKIDLTKVAPKDWDGRRVLLSFSGGDDSRAQIVLAR